MNRILILIHFNFIIITSAFNCKLPNGCEINDVHLQINHMAHEKTSIEVPGILCDIRDEKFEFTFPNMPIPKLDSDFCDINELLKEAIEFNFHCNFILSKQFNITNLLRYSWYFDKTIIVNFVNLKGFELDMINDLDKNKRFINQINIDIFNCVKCKMEFYSNGRLVKTCQDIIDSNNGLVRSLFQIRRYIIEGLIAQTVILVDSQFKTTLCPLVFMYSNISTLFITGLADTFYKTNILTFENRTFEDLNSNIKELYFLKIENINIDSNLLEPSVFQNLRIILFIGSVKMIDGNSFNRLPSLYEIELEKEYYRDIIHKNGIKWIRNLNSNLDVNLSNFTETLNKYYRTKFIQIVSSGFSTEIRLSKLFPEKDFCLYKDYPFNQLVILFESAYDERVLALLNSTTYYTCTYLWLAQYFDLILKIVNINSFKMVVRSKQFKSMSTCNFQYKLSLCDKSTYQTQNWWGKIDYFILNKQLQSAFI